jgi:serine/threonine protein kinase
MRLSHHANIVNVYSFGYFNTNECIIPYIALELCKHGELFEYVSELGGLSMNICKRYLVQLISALQHLHANGIYHRLSIYLSLFL